MSMEPEIYCGGGFRRRLAALLSRLWWWRKRDSPLIVHAERELRIAGLFDQDADYGGMIGEAVIEMVRVFTKQGHSGFSAHICIDVFSRVAAFQPLGALTGADDEWHEIEEGRYQNLRCSRVFKENGQAYDIEGIIWRDADGLAFTNFKSRVPVSFPYTPEQKIVDAETGLVVRVEGGDA